MSVDSLLRRCNYRNFAFRAVSKLPAIKSLLFRTKSIIGSFGMNVLPLSGFLFSHTLPPLKGKEKRVYKKIVFCEKSCKELFPNKEV